MADFVRFHTGAEEDTSDTAYFFVNPDTVWCVGRGSSSGSQHCDIWTIGRLITDGPSLVVPRLTPDEVVALLTRHPE